MNLTEQAILRSARVAELHDRVASVAALCKRPAAVELPDGNADARRRLLMLLARERRRNASLAKIIEGSDG